MLIFLLSGLSSLIGSVIITIVLIVLLGPMLLLPLLAIVVPVFLFVGIGLDRRLRKKYNLTDRQTFSPLWTWLSVIELSLFTIFTIVIVFGLIPVIVLIYDLIIYLILSVLILSYEINKGAHRGISG